MKLTEATGATPEARLVELGLDLPSVPNAVADYVTHTQIGNIIYTSGMLPWIDGVLKSITGDLSKIKCIHG